MAFEIVETTRAKLATVTARVERHGDDEKPAVTLGIVIETANSILDLLDPTLRPTLYKAADDGKQADIPDVEKTLSVLRSNAIERVLLDREHEGWTLNLDIDIDESRPMAFGGCRLSGFSVEPKQGGSVTLKFRVGTSDIDAEKSGVLLMHNGEPIWITLIAPKPGQADEKATPTRQPDAGDLFAERHGGGDPGDDAESEGGETDVEAEEAGADDATRDWSAPPAHLTEERVDEKPGRTARGRAATKAALAARVGEAAP